MSHQPEIVFISHWRGHTFHFMECVLPFFLKRGYVVYHVTDKPEEAERFLRERVDFGAGRIETIGMESVEPEAPSRRKDAQLCRVEAHWKGVQAALEKLYARMGRKVGIFHTWVDLYSHGYLSRRVIAEAMPAPWCGLYVHPAELRIYKTWKRRLYENVVDLLKMGRMFPCRLRTFDAPDVRKVYFLDELLLDKARLHFRPRVGLSAFPEWIDSDFEENFSDLERAKQLAGERKILCLCGFLSKRKGLLTLLQAAQKGLEGWFFVFAGPIEWESFSEAEKTFIQQAQELSKSHSIFIERQLQDGEINTVVQRSDVVYLAYENFFHSSNVQVKAAFFGKPTIAGPRNLIAERTRRFEMGWCLPEISSDAVVTLLREIGPVEVDTVAKKARFREFLAEHSPEVLEKKLAEIAGAVGSAEALLEPPIAPTNTKI